MLSATKAPLSGPGWRCRPQPAVPGLVPRRLKPPETPASAPGLTLWVQEAAGMSPPIGRVCTCAPLVGTD